MEIQNAPKKCSYPAPTILIFTILLCFSMYALWKINTGIMDVGLAWPWLVSLVVSAIGLLMLACDTK